MDIPTKSLCRFESSSQLCMFCIALALTRVECLGRLAWQVSWRQQVVHNTVEVVGSYIELVHTILD